MYYTFLNSFMCCVFLQASLISAQSDCRPRPTLVRTYSVSEAGKLNPQFKMVHRCSGIKGAKALSKYRCVPVKDTGTLVNMTLRTSEADVEYVSLKNDTECETGCVCQCGGVKKHTPTCELGFYWDDESCECIPTAVKARSENCHKTKSGYVSIATFWIVVVVEFVVIMLVVLVSIDALRCRRKKEGVLHKTRNYMASVSSRLASYRITSVATPKIKLDETDGGHFAYGEDSVFSSRIDVNST